MCPAQTLGQQRWVKNPACHTRGTKQQLISVGFLCRVRKPQDKYLLSKVHYLRIRGTCYDWRQEIKITCGVNYHFLCFFNVSYALELILKKWKPRDLKWIKIHHFVQKWHKTLVLARHGFQNYRPNLNVLPSISWVAVYPITRKKEACVSLLTLLLWDKAFEVWRCSFCCISRRFGFCSLEAQKSEKKNRISVKFTFVFPLLKMHASPELWLANWLPAQRATKGCRLESQ